MPRHVITVTIVPGSDIGPTVQVFGLQEMDVARAYCRRERVPMNEKKNRAAMEEFLVAIKSSAEGR
jgi:hypothetical protein